MRGWVHLPDYLKSHEPDDTYDPAKTLGAYSFGKEHLGKTWFELLELDPDPERRETWDTAMNMFEDQMPIQGIFPFASLKEQVEQDPARPFFVDIGGGKGQSCFAIQKEIGEAFKGRFILQDLPGLINTLNPEVLPGVEIMAYDAFTPQPIKSMFVCPPRTFHPIHWEPRLSLRSLRCAHILHASLPPRLLRSRLHQDCPEHGLGYGP